MWASFRRLGWVTVAAVAGLVVGYATRAIAGRDNGSVVANMDPATARAMAEYAPPPHHVPPSPGGVSFRFAMAHDVIHERYPKHGPAYHRERIRVTREKLKGLHPDAPLALSLHDDLASAHARLGEYGEAIALMRAELARQRALADEGAALYTTLANLGTFLTYESFQEAAASDGAARERFREGVASIREAIKANPNAHFGRETWQAAAAEFLLAAMEKPERLKVFDCLGNRLGLGIETAYGRAVDRGYAMDGMGGNLRAWLLEVGPERVWEGGTARMARYSVTKVGAEDGWDKVPVPSHRERVAFDEPMLGIVGMWRQGGGPEAHFALAIGETMLRVGQRRIAWAAFTRAGRMADSFWPDPAIHEKFCRHCRERAEAIATSLPPAETPTEAEFEAELAHGEAYQREYRAYEARKIAAGASIDDKAFHEEFHAGREPIASPSGSEEWFAYLTQRKIARHQMEQALEWGVLVAGLAALAAALVMRYWPAAKPPGEATSGTP